MSFFSLTICIRPKKSESHYASWEGGLCLVLEGIHIRWEPAVHESPQLSQSPPTTLPCYHEYRFDWNREQCPRHRRCEGVINDDELNFGHSVRFALVSAVSSMELIFPIFSGRTFDTLTEQSTRVATLGPQLVSRMLTIPLLKSLDC